MAHTGNLSKRHSVYIIPIHLRTAGTKTGGFLEKGKLRLMQ